MSDLENEMSRAWMPRSAETARADSGARARNAARASGWKRIGLSFKADTVSRVEPELGSFVGGEVEGQAVGRMDAHGDVLDAQVRTADRRERNRVPVAETQP